MGESIDVNELCALVGAAAVEFAFAAESLGDVAALFDAVIASTPANHLAHRLAKLGSDLCETRRDKFGETRDEYVTHAERFAPAITSCDNGQ